MYKYFSTVLICIFCLGRVAAQAPQNKNIELFCKVWGFLKYYHPEVGKGNIDWDSVFIKRVEEVENLKPQDLSNYFVSWITELGDLNNKEKNKNYNSKDYFHDNYCMKWIDDTNLLSPKLNSLLNRIKDIKYSPSNYYVEKDKRTGLPIFNHEKTFSDSIYPSVPLRLLTLSRYWNIINYFYPYKYKTDENWNTVLSEMIPIFINSEDTVQYQLGLLELSAKLCDTHAGIDNLKYLKKVFGDKIAPFKTQIIDSHAIVTKIYNDSLAKKNDIQLGDEVLNIKGDNIPFIIEKYSKYLSASNTASNFRTISNYLFLSNQDSIYVKINRQGKIIEKYIYTYHPSIVYKNFSSTEDTTTQYKIIADKIGYINMGLLRKEDVKATMKSLWNTKAIIFDIRNYPHGTILELTKYLYSQPKQVFNSITPEFRHPGIYKIENTYRIGKRNKNPYKGKVIILVNEETQSHAESTAILLQNIPGAVTVGSQTAGADGQVISFILPGNIKAWITGEGIIIPDVQRNGVSIDIKVQPSIEDIRNQKDAILGKAIEIANIL